MYPCTELMKKISGTLIQMSVTACHNANTNDQMKWLQNYHLPYSLELS